MKSRSLIRLLRSFKPLARNDRGNVLLLTAMGLPIMIGGAGFGVDTAQWYLWQRELQTAVDAAALSGAYSLAQGKPIQASAEAELARNIDVATVISQNVASDNWDGGAGNAVTVTAATQRRLPFSAMFLDTAPTMNAAATAAVIDDGQHCMISLEEEAEAAISVQGRALLKLGCGIASNSRADPAIDFDGQAKIEASPISAVGGITANDTNLISDSTIRPYSVEQKNPFEDVSYTGTPVNRTYDRSQAALQPGRYQSGLRLEGDHTMAPGVYVIDGGVLTVNGNHSLTGSGVAIVLKNGATLQINGTSNLNLTPPTAAIDGIPAGMLIFEAGATGGTATRTSTINGNAKLHLGGAIYLPSHHVMIDGNSEPTTKCLMLVSRTMAISGNTEIVNTCPPGYSHPGIGAKVVRLVK